MNKETILAISLLAGTIIGAGIFALPYFFNLLGFLPALFYLFFFMFFYYFIHLMYIKVLSLEKEKHQFFYLLHKYFSFKKANFLSILIFLGLIFVMLVYLVLAGSFLNSILKNINLIYLVLFFWLFSSIFIFTKLKFISLAEFLGILSIFLIILILFFYSFNFKFDIDFFKKNDFKIYLLPLGTFLFSFAGRPALHKLFEFYKQKENFSLKKVIFFGTFIPLVIYFLFVISVLKINPNVSPETLNSLNFLPNNLIILLIVLGLITLWTSYFMIGVNVKDILILDLKISKNLASFLVLFLPIFLYFIGFNNFLKVISFVGGVFLGLEGVIIIRLWQKAFYKKSRFYYFSYFFYLFFLIALIYEVIFFFNF
ncbi:MAG: aromatic amino acid transport family protein [Candidatus Pacearchaeota archaeon]